VASLGASTIGPCVLIDSSRRWRLSAESVLIFKIEFKTSSFGYGFFCCCIATSTAMRLVSVHDEPPAAVDALKMNSQVETHGPEPGGRYLKDILNL
jgi:hypothetical protein